ncbi:MAG TPA: response regulator transcription factor [Verrucomicrobiae bacterium]|nr:response regulator transcription factor [Verrucomicrobiae bacterium]
MNNDCMTFGPRVLVVDDEPEFRDFVKACLERDGYRVLEANNGRRGLEVALKEKPDLVVLDRVMPELAGTAVCAELRRLNFQGPILMLTSKREVEQRISGLSSGADDYLPKPVDPRELLARIKALLRRQHRNEQKSLILKFGDVLVDLEKREATRGTTPIKLTKTEFALLEVLARNAGKPVLREQILDSVWGYTYFPTTRTVDTHIYRLRKKLGDDGERPKWIRKIQGEGYCLAASAVVSPAE